MIKEFKKFISRGNVVDFLIIAFCIFVVVKLFNKITHKEEKKEPAPIKPNQEVLLEDFFSCGYENAQEVIAAQEDLEAQLIEKGMEIVDVDIDAFKTALTTVYGDVAVVAVEENLAQ